MERAAASAFPRASHPADQEPTTHAEVGTGHRARTWNYSLNITSVDPPIVCSLTTCDLASHIDFQHSREANAIVGAAATHVGRVCAPCREVVGKLNAGTSMWETVSTNDLLLMVPSHFSHEIRLIRRNGAHYL